MGEMRMHTNFLVENASERDHLGDLGTDQRIILKWVVRKCDVADWIKVAQDRVQRRAALVNTGAVTD
jgi:hypothetical protein